MRRILSAIVACFFVLIFSASCSATPSSSAGVPNPMAEYDTPDFNEAAGFKVTAQPATYSLHSCYLINDTIAQLDFAVDEFANVSLRVAVDTGEDISGDYNVYEETSAETVDGITVTLKQTAMGPALAMWSKDGYAFSLAMAEVGDNDFLLIVTDFVKQIGMEPVPAPAAE